MSTYGEPGHSSWHDRIEQGHCVVCNVTTDGLYYCARCAMNSDYESARVNAAELHGASATVVSRAMQRRVDCAAEYEQLTQLWSVIEHPSPVAPDQSDLRCSSSVLSLRIGSKIMAARAATKDPLGVSRSKSRRYDRFCEGWGKLGRIVAKHEPKRRAKAERARANSRNYWARVKAERAVKVWRHLAPALCSVAWAWLDEATKPGSRSAA